MAGSREDACCHVNSLKNVTAINGKNVKANLSTKERP